MKWTPRLALAALVLACALCGGSSRADSVSLIILRPVAVVALVALLLTRREIGTAGLRLPAALLAAFAATIAVQLIPLPPSLWASLPGHQGIADGAAAVGLETPWRPLSLTPELTLNALLALTPALGMLVALWVLPPAVNRWILVGLLLTACASCALGVVQVMGDGQFGYLYEVTNDTLPVGLLANRNHQAAFLAACIPFLVAWAQAPLSRSGGRDRRRRRPTEQLGIRPALAACVGLLFVVVILMTGSRSGTVLALAAILYVLLQAVPRFRAAPRRIKLAVGVGAILLAGAVALFATSGRSLSLERLAAVTNDAETDQRFTALPTVVQMTTDFLPLGSGFGSFDPVYRIYEADSELQPVYFNHAHNDLIELAMTGGIPALAVLVAFLLWWGWRTVIAWRRDGADPGVRLARAASASIALLLAASLSDYPLRTPFLTLFFALLAGWLAAGTANRGARRAGSAVANPPSAG